MAFQGDSIFWVEVEKIVPNPFQPRREFDESKLKELAESVQMYGILQPLTVTRKEIQREDGTFYTEYELIAGERRLRASKIAGLSQVPVIIREGEDSEQEKLELAIIENLQREDLNAVDRALAFKQLAEVFGLSHTMVAKKVGRSREYVSNSIRLLALPEYMLNSLRQAEMAEGHARTLLMLNDRPEEQDVVFREILLKKLSVREVERIVRKIATDKVRKRHPGDFDAELIEMEKRFMETLGTRVQIQKTDFGGKLTIDYFSVDDLEGMLKNMKKEQEQLNKNEQSSESILTSHTPLSVSAEEDFPLSDNFENEFKVAKSDVAEESQIQTENQSASDNKEVKNEFSSTDINTRNETEDVKTEDTEIKTEIRSESPITENKPEPEVGAEVTPKIDQKEEKINLIESEEKKTLLEEPVSPLKLDSPLSRPQIVAESHYKSPVYIQPVRKHVEGTPKEIIEKKEEEKIETSSDNEENNVSREDDLKEKHSELENTKENKPITEPVRSAQTQPQPDESGLYSIRNFGI